MDEGESAVIGQSEDDATGRASNAESGPFAGWRLPGLDYASFRLLLVAKVMDRLSMREFGRITELSMAEFRVLGRLILAEEGLTVREIAERAWVDRAEVSRAAVELETRGLTARRPNPDDRRTPILFATDQGREAHEPLMRARGEFHASLVECLSETEQRQLDAILEKLAANMFDRLGVSR